MVVARSRPSEPRDGPGPAVMAVSASTLRHDGVGAEVEVLGIGPLRRSIQRVLLDDRAGEVENAFLAPGRAAEGTRTVSPHVLAPFAVEPGFASGVLRLGGCLESDSRAAGVDHLD